MHQDNIVMQEIQAVITIWSQWSEITSSSDNYTSSKGTKRGQKQMIDIQGRQGQNSSITQICAENELKGERKVTCRPFLYSFISFYFILKVQHIY